MMVERKTMKEYDCRYEIILSSGEQMSMNKKLKTELSRTKLIERERRKYLSRVNGRGKFLHLNNGFVKRASIDCFSVFVQEVKEEVKGSVKEEKGEPIKIGFFDKVFEGLFGWIKR